MVLAWSTSFANKVKQNTKKFTPSKPKVVVMEKPSIVVKPEVNYIMSSQTNASDYIVKPVKKSAYDIQMEKIARTEAFKNRSVEENLKIHSAKVLGEKHDGNTDNYFIDNKTGKISTSSQTSNLSTFLTENNLDYLTPESLTPKKLEAERIASQNKTVFLRKEAEIKSLGGSVPELNLLNKQQVNKYNEISNIITQSKPDDSQQALDDVNSSVNEFLSLDNPLTQKPKTNGLAQVGQTGINDSTVIALGFTPEDIGDFQVPEVKQTDDNKNFEVDNKTSTGLIVAGVGAGLLALLYLSKRK
tara:strand:- start:1593 stop:2495 length:903 start_codon:yes stop_codon:yes gene_type:complete